jgi:hypothetical protein
VLGRRGCLIGCLLALLCIVAVIATGVTWWLIRSEAEDRSHALAEAASHRVQPGMPLNRALSELRAVDGLWRELSCGSWPHHLDPTVVVSESLFLYGDHDVRIAGVVYIQGQGPPGQELVVAVGLPENYRLTPFLDRCV